jgi:hypothetical protein
VAERLKQAATEGRILAHELEDRLGAALRARTYGDLDDVVADLPGARLASRPRSRTRELIVQQPLAAAVVLVVAVVMVFVVAAIVVASLVALSSLWIVFAFIMLIHRGGRFGPPHRRYYGPPRRGPGARPGAGRPRTSRGAWW